MVVLLDRIADREMSGRVKNPVLEVGEMSNYQMPRPMSTMPMASHPNTPTEIIVSSVMLDSGE
jgi:hypothetical protein